jgi:hypothetical protein
MCSRKIAVLSLLIPHKTGGEFMCSNSPPGLCGNSRERTAIFPEHMNSPPVLCGLVEKELKFMCSGKIAVLSLLFPHKTGGEFMCSGKISILPLIIPHKTGGEFMCSGKIAVLSLLVHTKQGVSSC